MATISKAAANRNLITRTVVAALRTQGPEAAQTLEALIYRSMPPAGLSLEQLFGHLADYLERSTYLASELSSEVLSESAQDITATQAVAEAVEVLREEIQWQREQVTGTYGQPVAQEFGFSGTLPYSADQLIEMSKSLESRLRKNTFPTQTRRGRPALQAAQIADVLARTRVELEQSSAHDARETRETQQARQARDKAIELWTQDYRGVADIAVGLFELARMPSLAERVRPTARRRQQLPEQIDLDEGHELEDAGDPEDEDLEERAVD